MQERARLEQAVEDKIAEERRTQLQRKRKEQEQRLQEQVRCNCCQAMFVASRSQHALPKPEIPCQSPRCPEEMLHTVPMPHLFLFRRIANEAMALERKLSGTEPGMPQSTEIQTGISQPLVTLPARCVCYWYETIAVQWLTPVQTMQAELERILEENQKLLEQAQTRTSEQPEAKAGSGRLQTLVPTVAASEVPGARELADDVFRLGASTE